MSYGVILLLTFLGFSFLAFGAVQYLAWKDKREEKTKVEAAPKKTAPKSASDEPPTPVEVIDAMQVLYRARRDVAAMLYEKVQRSDGGVPSGSFSKLDKEGKGYYVRQVTMVCDALKLVALSQVQDQAELLGIEPPKLTMEDVLGRGPEDSVSVSSRPLSEKEVEAVIRRAVHGETSGRGDEDLDITS